MIIKIFIKRKIPISIPSKKSKISASNVIICLRVHYCRKSTHKSSYGHIKPFNRQEPKKAVRF